MQQELPPRITVRAEDGTCAEIVPALGGIVSSFKVPSGGELREVLFRHAGFWDVSNSATRGGIPLLFPICGRLRLGKVPGGYVAQGQTFHLPLHGFAMRRVWAIDERAESALVCSLSDDAATRAQYPYAFALRSVYRVAPGSLSLSFEVRNTGLIDLPFSAGWHPYFVTPPAGAQKARMRITVPARSCGQYDSTYTAFVAWGAPLSMPLTPDHPQFSHVLHEAAGPDATVTWPDGFRVELRATHSGDMPMPFWQLHTDPALPFVCVEPWSSPPNALNTRRALQTIAPGVVWRMALVLKAQSGL